MPDLGVKSLHIFLNLFSYPSYEVGAVIVPLIPREEEGEVRGNGGKGCNEDIQS